jgi:GT2 family glycosyltransferase
MPRWLKSELWGFLGHLDYGDEEVPLDELKKPFFGGNMAFRREVFERVGEFNPDLGRKGAKLHGGEEVDLFRRMLEAGMRVVYAPDAIVEHVIGSEKLKKTYFRRLHFASGHTWAVCREDLNTRTIVGIPLFLLPQLWRSVSTYLREGFEQGFANAFRREMNIWFLLGFMRGRLLIRQGDGRRAS